MKKFFSLLVFTALTVYASAQITWNAKGGIGIANCYGDEVDTKSHIVGKIGVGLEKPLAADWSLMPSLEIAWKGAKYEESGSGYKFEQNLNTLYIQIPVVAAYRLNLSDSWNMTIKAGPYFAYGISGSMSESLSGNYGNDNADYDIFSDGDANRFDAGLDIGIDFECHSFVFGLEYEHGFVNFAPEDGNIKNSAFYATIGWKF